MLLTTKLYIVGGLLATILALSLFSCHEVKHNAVVKTQLKEATANIVAANKSLEVRSAISDKTEDIVTKAVVKTQELTIKASNLRDKIDETNKGVGNGSISNAVADAAYVDSMWDAYCEAKPSASRCTSRQSTPRLPGK
jgi:hypothetical protein